MTRLDTQHKVIGFKQSKKAIQEQQASCVFLAQDVEERLADPIRQLCRQNGVEVVPVATMQQLGQACGIDVGAAVAAVLREDCVLTGSKSRR